MKTSIKLFFIVPVLLFFVACGGDSRNSAADDKLGKLEVEIPKELKDNEEVVEFINGMAEVSDDYALMIDETLEKSAEFIGKETEELSMMEQIELVKITGEAAIKSATSLVKWGEYMEKRTDLQDELSDDELKALESVMLRFEKRMEQIETKHSDVLNNSSNE